MSTPYPEFDKNDSSGMLGNEIIYGSPYNLPQIRIDSWKLRSRNKMKGSFKLEGKYDTSQSEKKYNQV